MHYQEQLKDMEAIPPINGFEEMILLTNQGKLWNFPIDNEQGKLENLIFFKLKLDNFLSLATKTLSDIKLITLKKNVAFGFHLSLDPKIVDFLVQTIAMLKTQRNSILNVWTYPLTNLKLFFGVWVFNLAIWV